MNSNSHQIYFQTHTFKILRDRSISYRHFRRNIHKDSWQPILQVQTPLSAPGSVDSVKTLYDAVWLRISCKYHESILRDKSQTKPLNRQIKSFKRSTRRFGEAKTFTRHPVEWLSRLIPLCGVAHPDSPTLFPSIPTPSSRVFSQPHPVHRLCVIHSKGWFDE